jgi:hypothetical protein
MSYSAGFDIISEEKIYWNQTLPSGDYYYVQAGYNLTDGNVSIVYKTYVDEGVQLVFVKRKVA